MNSFRPARNETEAAIYPRNAAENVVNNAMKAFRLNRRLTARNLANRFKNRFAAVGLTDKEDIESYFELELHRELQNARDELLAAAFAYAYRSQNVDLKNSDRRMLIADMYHFISNNMSKYGLALSSEQIYNAINYTIRDYIRKTGPHVEGMIEYMHPEWNRPNWKKHLRVGRKNGGGRNLESAAYAYALSKMHHVTHKGDPEKILEAICESMREYLEKKGVAGAAEIAAAKCAEVRAKRNATRRNNGNSRKLTPEEIRARYLSLIMRGPWKSYKPVRWPGGGRRSSSKRRRTRTT
jgi:hypothetical protein